LTQRSIAQYIVGERDGHYHFTVKGNQKNLLEDIELFFNNRQQPNFVENSSLEHGRIETRKIWTTSELNGYLDFPHVGQAFVIERCVEHKKSGKKTIELAYGVTSLTTDKANAKQVLAVNRGHWCIENKCHYILDETFDEDRSRIRTGYGPENVTRLRRFAIGAILSKGVKNVSQKIRKLARNVRLVFDYLGMTQNSCPAALRG